MLSGYVTETIQDHNDTLALFARWQKFVASGTINAIELGSTLFILDNSPLGHSIEEFGITFLDDKKYLWVSDKNPELDIAERIRRRLETHKEAIKYKWPITRSLYRLSTMKSYLLDAISYYERNTA